MDEAFKKRLACNELNELCVKFKTKDLVECFIGRIGKHAFPFGADSIGATYLLIYLIGRHFVIRT